MGKMDRGKLDDTLAAMFSNVQYRGDYLFYAHMLGQCSIKIDKAMKAPAGVAFVIDHYNLYINPNKFDKYNLHGRLTILKHEMLHILFGHVERTENRKPLRWNWATDCAINQLCNKDHLPDDGVTPKTIKEKFNLNVPLMESSEKYYNLLDIIQEKPKSGEGQEGQEGQEGESNQKGSPQKGSEDPGMGTHDTWEESTGDGDLQEDITKKMIQKSQEETIKGKGTIPGQCGDWLEIFTRKSEVNWKKVLRGIVGNKRVGNRSTIMKSDRRFPNRPDLRGKVKDRTFNLLVIGDVSGSMSDQNVLDTLGEVRHICDITKTAVDLIQIDTVAYAPEKLTKKTKLIERKGCGGTTLYPALDMAKKHNLDFQAVVVLTDGGLFGDDIDHFIKLKKRVIWLVTKDGHVMDKMNSPKNSAFKLKV